MPVGTLIVGVVVVFGTLYAFYTHDAVIHNSEQMALTRFKRATSYLATLREFCAQVAGPRGLSENLAALDQGTIDRRTFADRVGPQLDYALRWGKSLLGITVADSTGQIAFTTGADWNQREVTVDEMSPVSFEFSMPVDAICENLPVGVWEEDYCDAKRVVDELKRQGATDFKACFTEHPQVLRAAAQVTEPIGMNRAARGVHDERDRKKFLEIAAPALVLAGLKSFYREEISALAERKKRVVGEHMVSKRRGERAQVRAITFLPESSEQSWNWTVSTEEDITERRQSEEALRISEVRHQQAIGQSFS